MNNCRPLDDCNNTIQKIDGMNCISCDDLEFSNDGNLLQKISEILNNLQKTVDENSKKLKTIESNITVLQQDMTKAKADIEALKKK